MVNYLEKSLYTACSPFSNSEQNYIAEPNIISHLLCKLCFNHWVKLFILGEGMLPGIIWWIQCSFCSYLIAHLMTANLQGSNCFKRKMHNYKHNIVKYSIFLRINLSSVSDYMCYISFWPFNKRIFNIHIPNQHSV